MNTQPGQPLEDVVDRAADALRSAAVPAGPSPLLTARTRQVLARLALDRPAAGAGGAARLWRVAAAVLVGGAGAAGWLALNRPGPQTASTSAVVPHGVGPKGADDGTRPARLTGYVRVEGVSPELLNRPTAVPPGPVGPGCGHHPPPTDASLLVAANGGIANVVVSVVKGLPDDTEYPRPAAPAVLDQKDCVYFPRVIPMQVGQELVARNSDPFLHSVHTNPIENAPVNIAQYTVDPIGARVKSIKAAETFKVTCDLHPWMIAWVAAFDHPFYAVTNADGSFDMPAVPPGTYTLRAWHERLGSVLEQVTVSYEGKLPAVRFQYGPERVAAALGDRVPTADASGAIGGEAVGTLKPCCVGKR